MASKMWKGKQVSYAIVFLGAGLGGALRHGTNLLGARLFGLDFPYGTVTVNILGSFLMAVLVEIFALRVGLPQSARLFLTTGLLGGYTTFSSFSLDAMSMFDRQQWALGIAYVLVTLLGGLAAFLAGMVLVRTLLGAAA